MSRRTLGFIAAGIVVAAVIAVVAGTTGSKPSNAAAGPSPQGREARSAAPDPTGPGPHLDVSPGTPEAKPATEAAPPVLAAHVPPELQARVSALAAGRSIDPAAAGTAAVRTNPAMIDDSIAEQRLAAMKVLATNPNDVNALRVVVSAACASNDVNTARKYAGSLPEGDRGVMRKVCHKAGVNLDPSDHWKAGTAPTPPVKQRPPR